MFRVRQILTYKSKFLIAPALAVLAVSVAVAETDSKVIECSRVCWCRRAATVYRSDLRLSARSQSAGRYRLSFLDA